MLTLKCLGWRESHQAWLEGRESGVRAARVAAVQGGSLLVLGLHEDPLAPQAVQYDSSAGSPLERPTVGDWVACRALDGGFRVLEVMPRSACLVRKAKGRASEPQLIAANVERVFVVTAVGGDLSARRLERYLTQVWASGASPVIVLNKVDQAHAEDELLGALEEVAAGVPIARVSAVREDGLRELSPYLTAESTVAFVGSSGVGKSSLINRLLGSSALATGAVREHDQTGMHTTTRRELVRAAEGFLLIDTPGMRELGLIDAEEGLSAAFPELAQLASRCRFADCGHRREPGCQVRAAVERGHVPAVRLASYLSLAAELDHNEQRAQQGKQRSKAIHRAQRERRKLHGRFGLKDD